MDLMERIPMLERFCTKCCSLIDEKRVARGREGLFVSRSFGDV